MLAGREVAIVAEVAGTTRDVLEVSVDLDGLLVIVCDGAGLREAEDRVERLGVEKARTLAGQSDLVLWLQEASALCVVDETIERCGATVVKIGSKCDLDPGKGQGARV